ATDRSVVETPKHGWAEVDPDLLWYQVCKLTSSIVEDNYDILALIFSGHMAGVIPVDKDGNALRKLIMWIDERASGYPKSLWRGPLRVKGYNLFDLLEFIYITGGAPGRTGKDPLSKILWIKDMEPDVWSKTYKILGTNSFLIMKATGSYVISPDDAALTWLVDTRSFSFRWSRRLLDKYGIREEMLPRIIDSTRIAGFLTRDAAQCLGLREGIPVVVGSGDMTSAAIGSGAIRENEVHIYIGTSDWVASHVRRRKVDLFNYIGSIPSGIPGYYLLVAEQEVAGGALDKILELLEMKGMYEEALALAEKSNLGARGLLFTPWLYGERSPIDDPHIRGAIINMSLVHSKGDLIRAVLEGVALNIKWVYNIVERMTRKQEYVNIVGGGAKSDLWCQIVANAINRVVRRIAEPQDTTLRGASVIAAVALGLTSFEDAVTRFKVDREFKPEPEAARSYENLFKVYVKAYGKLKDLMRELSSIHW
ncbi:MAG: xylulokinase, partial [Desulfurococcus sp.]|uniref:xylulokinase n=1 Tax=Desulfurococcus sp. TaxID=51678 RepID=UPI003D152D99